MRVGLWVCAALVAFGVYRWYSQREVTHAPGMLAAEAPLQRTLESDERIERDGFRLRPRADFRATVRVLRRQDYSRGALAKLVPTDFAVGWGPMSDSKVLAEIEIGQGNRFYHWRTATWPLERHDIETHSANWHVIADNDEVRRVLERTRAGHILELRGRLVDIEGKQGGMRTSMTRDDTGAGACEILLATSARRVSTE